MTDYSVYSEPSEYIREAVDLPLTRKVAATEWLTERENPRQGRALTLRFDTSPPAYTLPHSIAARYLSLSRPA